MDVIRAGQVRNVCTVRNPLTAVASFREMFGGNIEQIAKRIRHSLQAADTWRHESENTLFIHFDELTSQSREQVERLSEFLGLQLSEEQLDAVEAETNLNAVRRKTADLAANAENLKREGQSRYDPGTHYHLGHAKKASSRRWQEELTPEEQEIACDILHPWLDT